MLMKAFAAEEGRSGTELQPTGQPTEWIKSLPFHGLAFRPMPMIPPPKPEMTAGWWMGASSAALKTAKPADAVTLDDDIGIDHLADIFLAGNMA